MVTQTPKQNEAGGEVRNSVGRYSGESVHGSKSAAVADFMATNRN